MDGATFRRHYGKSVRNPHKPESRREDTNAQATDTVDPGTICPLIQNLVSIPEPSIPVLLAWFQEQGIWIHENLEIRQMAGGGGIAVFAVGAGIPQQVGKHRRRQNRSVLESLDLWLTISPSKVCKIPRSAILSSHTTPLASRLPRKTRNQIPPIVLLSLSLLYEFRLGPESRYWGYLQSLPRRHVPIVSLWDVDFIGGTDGKTARETVRGTAVDDEIKRIRKDGHGTVSCSYSVLHYPFVAREVDIRQTIGRPVSVLSSYSRCLSHDYLLLGSTNIPGYVVCIFPGIFQGISSGCLSRRSHCAISGRIQSPGTQQCLL